jgi:hypothetical protein
MNTPDWLMHSDRVVILSRFHDATIELRRCSLIRPSTTPSHKTEPNQAVMNKVLCLMHVR